MDQEEIENALLEGQQEGMVVKIYQKGEHQFALTAKGRKYVESLMKESGLTIEQLIKLGIEDG